MLARLLGFLRRLFLGEDVVLVRQTKEQWERQFAAGTWDRLQEGQANTVEVARLISDCAHTKGGNIRVLDVGCGNGGLARLLSPEPSIAYTGIDISETALVAARVVAPNGTFIVADAEQPPLNLGIFDILVFNEVLYYMNPNRVLQRYRTYAAPNAHVFVSVMRFWRTPFIFYRMRHYLRIEKRLRVADSSNQWDIVVGHFI